MFEFKGKIAKLAWSAATIVVVLVGIAYFWEQLQPKDLFAAVATGHGRIEATEIDGATKFASRVQDVNVMEDDFVEAGQILARIDTVLLAARLREAEAQWLPAVTAKSSAAL